MGGPKFGARVPIWGGVLIWGAGVPISGRGLNFGGSQGSPPSHLAGFAWRGGARPTAAGAGTRNDCTDWWRPQRGRDLGRTMFGERGGPPGGDKGQRKGGTGTLKRGQGHLGKGQRSPGGTRGGGKDPGGRGGTQMPGEGTRTQRRGHEEEVTNPGKGGDKDPGEGTGTPGRGEGGQRSARVPRDWDP